MKRIGLIDIGSNTIRLVIFEFDKKTGLDEVLNIKTPARLSQYLTNDLTMTQEGIEVLTTTLSSFKRVSDKFATDELHPIATAAIRQSTNRDDIIKHIEQQLNITMRIIPEESEAFYGYYAITHTTNISDGISVDIGGGSTEVTLFKDKQLKAAHSFPFGVVTLTKKFFSDKPHNDKHAIKDMEKFLIKQFSQLDWLNDAQVALVGVGGSARNVARIHQSAHDYPIGGVHNYSMSAKDVEEVFSLIKKSSRDELKDVDGLSGDRIDIILPAVAVFKNLFTKINATQFTFSRKGLREGYVMHLISEQFPDQFNKENIRQDALYHLANEYKIEEKSAKQRVKLALSLLNQLIETKHLDISKTDKRLFAEGSYLYYLGSFINADSSSPHTYYIIANSMIEGFTHQERVKLALLASFKNKSLMKFYSHETKWLVQDELDTIQSLGGIIKFINALNISQTNVVDRIYLKKEKGDYTLYVFYEGEPVAEEYQANRQKKHIEKILKDKLSINFTRA
ncbi:exopolyphosphatase [Staphylococcus arlettae]|jgi:exopolyphosphatase / guanosine-5'-triphosphate,3'-diphosphate pyrophosphatase|uniref:exopolyphosphatase n=2 Tax=Staphylococcus TaxID=1279 RepID=A0A380C2S8_9STAP|nr:MULTISPECIES: exopolyphosphatase [Staphylococcus]KAB2479059.1 exopolyphosphatase [Staphylococcus sp. CH99b_3]MCD8815657.1 exopolyphosphatase [Staphylococcus arlettae]MCD8834574.1 exopolyphosphatase [Staphylococcus arlettae]MCD8839000.1 exopolyphosphatase [Staphylococcus arlettae]MCD8849890.1 exopolyphosphatase [Staphylococcus arlettae]